MKTAISIDTNVFHSAEKTAQQMGVSRSKLYTTALEEFLQNHDSDLVLKELEAVYGINDDKLDDDLMLAQYNLLGNEDW
jgi:predicted nucleic acid-binding protein